MNSLTKSVVILPSSTLVKCMIALWQSALTWNNRLLHQRQENKGREQLTDSQKFESALTCMTRPFKASLEASKSAMNSSSSP